MPNIILKMTNITKKFPGVKALDNVNIEAREGEVLALMGENGAGKSTLMKVLNGLLQPDGGEIELYGKKVTINSPAEALSNGIAMIYQELNPVLDMTVAENIFLGREFTYGKSFFVDKAELVKKAQGLLDEYGLKAKPEWTMRRLSIAQRQMIEIIRAISTGAKVLVMDEPTSSLTDDEIDTLFSVIKSLKNKNVAVIYISHRLDEIFEISDRVTVLRDGQYIDTVDTPSVTKDELVTMMVGRSLDNIFPKVEVPIGDTALKVSSLTRNGVFKDISFEAKKGEILGLYGLVGAGRSEVCRCIFGLDRYDSGSMEIDGKPFKAKMPSKAIAEGIVMVTEDRKETGLVLCRSIEENISLPNLNLYSKKGFIDKKEEDRKCEEISKLLTVKMSGLQQTAGNLSGGNQQKVVLCKWMMQSPKVIILDEPTRGIDVGAKAEIHALMCDFAKRGMAIVMISSELPEIIGMSDRVIVMGEGNIKGEFKRGSFSQNEILKCALGASKNE